MENAQYCNIEESFKEFLEPDDFQNLNSSSLSRHICESSCYVKFLTDTDTHTDKHTYRQTDRRRVKDNLQLTQANMLMILN